MGSTIDEKQEKKSMRYAGRKKNRGYSVAINQNVIARKKNYKDGPNKFNK